MIKPTNYYAMFAAVISLTFFYGCADENPQAGTVSIMPKESQVSWLNLAEVVQDEAFKAEIVNWYKPLYAKEVCEDKAIFASVEMPFRVQDKPLSLLNHSPQKLAEQVEINFVQRSMGVNPTLGDIVSKAMDNLAKFTIPKELKTKVVAPAIADYETLLKDNYDLIVYRSHGKDSYDWKSLIERINADNGKAYMSIKYDALVDYQKAMLTRACALPADRIMKVLIIEDNSAPVSSVQEALVAETPAPVTPVPVTPVPETTVTVTPVSPASGPSPKAIQAFSNGVGYLEIIRDYKTKDIALKKDRANLAIREFDRAIELYPDYFDAIFNRGVAYLVLGDAQNAAFNFNQAALADPSNFRSDMGQAELSLMQGNKKQALEWIDSAFAKGMPYGVIEAQPEFSSIHKDADYYQLLTKHGLR